MIKMVGLSRPIKLEWLTKTVELFKLEKSDSEIKEELNGYLSFEIKSPTNLRKTREILMNVWVKTPDEVADIKKIALNALEDDRTNKKAIHWCMILLCYPVLGDVAGLIGKITNIQDTFTTAWLKQKLFELWGERTTLLHSTDKILQTLKYLGVVENEKTGVYKIVRQKITDEASIEAIVMTILRIGGKAYYEISDLSNIPQMFPFDFSISHEALHNSKQFTLNNFGGKVVLTNES